MSAHVHVETFPAAWPHDLLSTFNLIASLRRALGDMSPDSPMADDGRMQVPGPHDVLKLTKSPVALVVETALVRLSYRSAHESVPVEFEGMTTWPSDLGEAAPNIHAVIDHAEEYGRRALRMLSDIDRRDPPVGPFGEYQAGQDAALALACYMPSAFMTTRTLVSATPWSKATVLYTSTSQMDRMPYLGMKPDHERSLTQPMGEGETLTLIREWTPMTVIVDAVLKNKPTIDLHPATNDMTTPVADPVLRLRLANSLPDRLRKAIRP